MDSTQSLPIGPSLPGGNVPETKRGEGEKKETKIFQKIQKNEQTLEHSLQKIEKKIELGKNANRQVYFATLHALKLKEKIDKVPEGTPDKEALLKKQSEYVEKLATLLPQLSSKELTKLQKRFEKLEEMVSQDPQLVAELKSVLGQLKVATARQEIVPKIEKEVKLLSKESSNLPLWIQENPKISKLYQETYKEYKQQKQELKKEFKKIEQNPELVTVVDEKRKVELLHRLENIKEKIAEFSVCKGLLDSFAEGIVDEERALQNLEDLSREMKQLQKAAIEEIHTFTEAAVKIQSQEQPLPPPPPPPPAIFDISKEPVEEVERPKEFELELMKGRDQQVLKRHLNNLQNEIANVFQKNGSESQREQAIKNVEDTIVEIVEILKKGSMNAHDIISRMMNIILEGIRSPSEKTSSLFRANQRQILDAVAIQVSKELNKSESAIIREDFANYWSEISSSKNEELKSIVEPIAKKAEFTKSHLFEKFESAQSRYLRGETTSTELYTATSELCKMMIARPDRTKSTFKTILQTLDESFKFEGKEKLSPKQEEVLNIVVSALQSQFSDGVEGKNLEDDLTTFVYLANEGIEEVSVGEKFIANHLAKSANLELREPIAIDPSSEKNAIIFHAATHLGGSLSGSVYGIEGVDLVRHSLQLGLKKLEKEHAGEVVRPTFIGNEWRFYVDDAEQLTKLLDQLAELSRNNPGVTIIPGSIAWSGKAKEEGRRSLAFNTLPVFENGRLVNLYHKKHESMDIDTISSFTNQSKDTFGWATDIEGYKEVIEQYNSNFFIRDDVIIGHEICNDHVHSTAKRDYNARFPSGSGADMHVLMAHGTIPNPQRSATQDGGRFAYVDHSSNAKSKLSIIHRSEAQVKQEVKHSATNDDTSELGAFKTHMPEEFVTLQPVVGEFKNDLGLIESGTKAKGVLSAIAHQAKISDDELKSKIVTLLKRQKEDFYPSEKTIAKKAWGQKDLGLFLGNVKKRYTFQNAEQIDSLIQALEHNGDLDTFESVLLQLAAEALDKEIILHRNTESLPVQSFSPDWKAPQQLGPTKASLEIALSVNDRRYFRVDNRESSEYQKIKKENQVLIDDYTKLAQDIDEKLAKNEFRTEDDRVVFLDMEKHARKDLEELARNYEQSPSHAQREYAAYLREVFKERDDARKIATKTIILPDITSVLQSISRHFFG